MKGPIAVAWSLVFVVTFACAALAQHGPPGPGPGPGGPGPGGPGPGGPGPGPGAAPSAPGPAAHPADLLREQRRRIQELRATRLKEIVRNEDKAAKLIEALNAHDAASFAHVDEKTLLLRRIEQVLRAALDAKVTAVHSDATVAISVGSSELVQAGVVFVLRSGSQVVGRAVVEKVARDSCECRVTSVTDGQKVQVGDAVVFGGLDTGDKADKPEDLAALLDKLTEIEHALRAEDDSSSKKVRELLSPAEAAKLAVFLEHFQEEIKALLDAPKNGAK